MNLPVRLDSQELVDSINGKMRKNAAQRGDIKAKWVKALEEGNMLIEEMKVPSPLKEKRSIRKVQSMYLYKTIGNVAGSLSSGLVAYGEGIVEYLARNLKNVRRIEDVYLLLGIVGAIGVVSLGGLAFKTFKLFLKYRDISKDIKNIGDALLKTLIHMKVITSSPSKLSVVASTEPYGAVFCHLEGGSTFERSTFIACLQEIVGPVDNPRYVIIRKIRLFATIYQKDYHSVPEIIGRKKNFASRFEIEWRRHVGPCQLVFARTIEGRKLILKSRIHSLASEFEENPTRVNKWK